MSAPETSRTSRRIWHGRQDLNPRCTVLETGRLPLSYARVPTRRIELRPPGPHPGAVTRLAWSAKKDFRHFGTARSLIWIPGSRASLAPRNDWGVVVAGPGDDPGSVAL